MIYIFGFLMFWLVFFAIITFLVFLAKNIKLVSAEKYLFLFKATTSFSITVLYFCYNYYYYEYGLGPRCNDEAMEHSIGQYHFKFPAKLTGYRDIPKLKQNDLIVFKVLFPEMVAKCDGNPPVGRNQLSDDQIRIAVIYKQTPADLERMLEVALFGRSSFSPDDLKSINADLKEYKNPDTSPPTDIFLGFNGEEVVWFAKCASWAPNPLCRAYATSYANLRIEYSFHMSHIEKWREINHKVKLLIENVIQNEIVD